MEDNNSFVPPPLDMEPRRQTVYSGVLGSAPPGEGAHFADCSPPETSGFGPVGAQRSAGQSRGPDQPWPPWTPLCGPQQTAGYLPWRAPVSRLSSVICLVPVDWSLTALSVKVCFEVLQQRPPSVSEALLHQRGGISCPVWPQEDEAARPDGRHSAFPSERLC